MATIWSPVEDGRYEDLIVNFNMTTNSMIIKLALSDEYRICRQVDTPSIPPEVADIIKVALQEYAEDIGMNLGLYIEPDKRIRLVDAALAWLEQETT